MEMQAAAFAREKKALEERMKEELAKKDEQIEH